MNGKINRFLGKQKSSREEGEVDKKMLCLDTFSISAGHLLVVVELGRVVLGDLLADVGRETRNTNRVGTVQGVGQRLEGICYLITLLAFNMILLALFFPTCFRSNVVVFFAPVVIWSSGWGPCLVGSSTQGAGPVF